jgi:hypothetical protein
MKTAPFLALLFAGLATSASAQNIVVMGALTASGAPSAPAVCQGGACPSPVAYQAPVAYPPRVACAPPVYASPNVIYIGGACGYPRPNYFSGYGSGYGCGYRTYSPSVIYFGGGQACVQGYNFTHCR